MLLITTNPEIITFTSLTNVNSGYIGIYNNQNLKKIDFDSLISSRDSMEFSSWSEPELSIQYCNSIEEINAQKLESFYRISIIRNDNLSELVFSELTTIYHYLVIENNNSLSKFICQK